MRTLAKVSVLAVIFGQLGFRAVAYYLPVPHPSWPFWVTLYAVSGALALRNIARLKPAPPDWFFVSFIGLVVVNFLILGQGSGVEFTARMLAILLGPYLCGRIIGKYAPFSLAGGLQVLSGLYIVLIGIQIVQNPALFESDRPGLFAPDLAGEVIIGPGGGDPTLYFIGITLGATWVVAFAALTFAAQRRGLLERNTKGRLLAIVLLFPLILLFIGSRTSVGSVVLCAGLLLLCASWISTPKKLGVMAGTVAVMFVFYGLLPELRKELLADVPNAMAGLNDFMATNFCSLGDGSVFYRVTLLSEAWRLFLQAPVFGIGATNFGLRWCGIEMDFGSPHSVFAHVLVEYGLVGAGLFAAVLLNILIMFFRRTRSRDHAARAAAWGLFAVWMFVAIQGQFIGNLFSELEFFLLTGLLISCLEDRRVSAGSFDRIQRRAAA